MSIIIGAFYSILILFALGGLLSGMLSSNVAPLSRPMIR